WFFLKRPLPTVRTFHGSALYESKYATSFKRRALQALVFPCEVLSSRLATVTFSGSPEIPSGYRSDGILPYGFDTTRVPVARSQHPSVLFVGTWEGRKRGRWLAEQFAYVRARMPTAELWLVSDRGEEGDQIRYIKFPSDRELRELY